MTTFCLAVLGGLLLISLPQQAGADDRAPALDLDTLRELRTEAAHRPRRIIFNNDGDDVIYRKKEITPEALLALRTSPLAGSQVDSIFYSNSLCFGQALHNSEVFEPFTSTEDMFRDNPMAEYLAAGIDPIAVMVEWGRANGVEIFWDMRMNDTHDAGLSGYGPLLLPTLKKEHPEYLVGAPDRQPPRGTWSSVNFAVPEVRDLALRFFEEVCQRFDVDGIELDFFRHACLFESVAWGGQASAEELDMMTDLVRRTREMTEREGLRRGRPILIAIRVPDSVDYCRAIGLDVERWLAEGLVDLLIGTCYFQLNPWEYLVELGHRYNVPVYPSLSESRVRGETRLRRNSTESYYARAMRAWAAGVDGIYMFNFFNPNSSLWRELGEPEGLQDRDKLYFLTVRNGSPDSYLAGGREYLNVPVLTPDNPWPLAPDRPVSVALAVGDDLAAARAAGLRPRVTCHVQTLARTRLSVTFNGEALGEPVAQDDWLDFEVPAELVRRGANQITLALVESRETEGQEEWSVVYEAGELPGRPWRKMGWTVGCVEEIQDEGLLIADRSTEAGSYGFYQYPGGLSPDEEAVVEARLKVLSGWSSILIENGVLGEEIQFYPDSVRARHTRLSHAMDTTDDFHTYRIVLRGQSFHVFVDDVLALDGTDRLAHPAWNGRSGVMFGAANSGSVGEALWESVKVRSGSGTLLDLALSVVFEQ